MHLARVINSALCEIYKLHVSAVKNARQLHVARVEKKGMRSALTLTFTKTALHIDFPKVTSVKILSLSPSKLSHARTGKCGRVIRRKHVSVINAPLFSLLSITMLFW
jgi:hypothetical protein